MISCRILPHETNDGPANMALDETLLDLVARSPEAAIVRTYDWSVPTLSLGYFQAFAAVASDPRWTGQALVRRPTGGGALWHDREVTYALVIPATHPLARPSTALYHAVHQAIAAQLARHGLAATRRGADPPRSESRADRPFLCFQDKDAEDVVVGRVKLVGSAQRRRAGAVLQHGSLLLARSSTTPELPGLTDLVAENDSSHQREESISDWSRRLRDMLAAVIGGPVFEKNLSNPEREHADNLRRTTYENLVWTGRR